MRQNMHAITFPPNTSLRASVHVPSRFRAVLVWDPGALPRWRDPHISRS